MEFAGQDTERGLKWQNGSLIEVGAHPAQVLQRAKQGRSPWTIWLGIGANPGSLHVIFLGNTIYLPI